ncbi:MAG: 4Fe-4S domain-containing protein [Acidimicrobiales bacterium]
MAWIWRGLREGVVTTRYPARPDDYGPGHRSSVRIVAGPRIPAGAAVERLCPTGAIGSREGALQVDRGRCILCGRCVDARPDLFEYDPSPETARVTRTGLIVPAVAEDDDALEAVRAELARRVRVLRRSVHIRHVDAGSDGSEEWEIAALGNPVYDVQRLGVYFTATPRHADLLLVTGAGAAGMAGPLRRTWDAMPAPKIVVAAGTDAISGGLVDPTYATLGGIGGIVPVDVWVPGSPPSPFSLLHGILLAVGLLPWRGRRP